MEFLGETFEYRDVNKYDLSLIKVFCAIYQHRNLTVAGATVLLTQPGMSRALSRLRYAFGDTLFRREGAFMEPTAKARRIAPDMFKALAHWSHAISVSRQFDPAQSRLRFRIGMNDLLGAILLPRLMHQVRVLGPSLGMTAVPASNQDLPEALDSGLIDLAVVSQLPGAAHLSAEFLFTEDYVVLMPPSLASDTTVLPLESYCRLGHVMVSYLNAERSWVDQALGGRNASRRVVATLRNFLAAPLVVAEAELICTLPRRFAMWSARCHGLTCRELPFKSITHDFHYTWLRTEDEAPASVWLRQRIAEAAGALCPLV